MKSLVIMGAGRLEDVYGPEQLRRIRETTTLLSPPLEAAEALESPALLGEAEILFSGWGGPVLDASFLNAAPSLKAVFYAAGSVRPLVTPAFWERGIPITSAFAANAVPVAEFTFAQIILALKKVPQISRICREGSRWAPFAPDEAVPGGYRSVVGLVSLGMIGRRVLTLLENLDVEVLVYDIRRDAALEREGRVRFCSLEELFSSSDVVSLHTALLPETEGMVGASLLGSMKKGASLINTARGKLIDEEALAAVLTARPDLSALLDVLAQEPPEADNPLPGLPNVYLTPHIAGSQRRECRRMGDAALEECRRFLAGESLAWRIDESMMETMA